ncbi:MAG: class I SAM-dependent methyltransferase, partial [Methylococcales bacterium]
SNAKKTRFVQQVILELKLKNVSVIHSRAEDYQPELGFDIVTTRAFSSLPDMVTVTAHLLNPNGVILAMKGQIPEAELAEIKTTATLIPISVPEVEAERCLVRINAQ